MKGEVVAVKEWVPHVLRAVPPVHRHAEVCLTKPSTRTAGTVHCCPRQQIYTEIRRAWARSPKSANTCAPPISSAIALHGSDSSFITKTNPGRRREKKSSSEPKNVSVSKCFIHSLPQPSLSQARRGILCFVKKKKKHNESRVPTLRGGAG